MTERDWKVPRISVVIRARNEGRNLERLLPLLQQQTERHQVVVVDNGSTDNTFDVALEHGATIVNIPKEEFNYPKASNLGVMAATGDHIVLLSAHSFPRDDNWLRRGLSHMDDPTVAGVYAQPITRRDADTSWTDRVFSYIGAGYRRLESVQKEKVFVRSKGQMGATNALYRGTLLREKPFDEEYGAGGEDVAWAKDRLEKDGLTIVRDPQFTVYHSHGLGPLGWIQQFREWDDVTHGPKPFAREKILYRRQRHE